MVRPKPHRAQPTDSNRGSQRLTFATTGTVLHLRVAALTWPVSGLKNGRPAGLAPRPAREPMRQAQYSNHVQQRPPDNRQPARPSAHRASWDDDRTPSGAATSG
jgi:hypothetical protein